jgi:DNA-binding MarR family transcriptional regulator
MEQDPRLVIERARDAARQLVEALGIGPAAAARAEESAPGEFASDRLTTARAWQRADALRHQPDDVSLFNDPAWNILLDLYIRRSEARKVSITSACLASRIPSSTAIRWIDRLHNSGWIEKIADMKDGRRIFLVLTDKAVNRIEKILDAAVDSDRKLGLGRLKLAQ